MKDSSNSVQSSRLISILGSIYGFRASAWLWIHTCKSDYPERIYAHTVLTFLSWCNGTLVENSHKIFGVCQNPLIISVVEENTEKQLHLQSCFFLIDDVLEFFNKSVIRTFWFLTLQLANSSHQMTFCIHINMHKVNVQYLFSRTISANRICRCFCHFWFV